MTEDEALRLLRLSTLQRINDMIPRWRKCSEERPEKPGMYLVSILPATTAVGHWSKLEQRWDDLAWTEGERLMRDGYWMPFPELPEEHKRPSCNGSLVRPRWPKCAATRTM